MVTIASAVLAVAAPAQEAAVVVAFGDSLTAGYGLPVEQGFVARLQASLREAGAPVTVVNAGVSGDTSAGGRARLDWLLAEEADLIIIELGANDALRGLDPAQTYVNLDDILTRIRARGITILLTGMVAPPNLGREYGDAFRSIYTRLAQEHGVMLYPFFLDGVVADRALNQRDGVHPNAMGVQIIVDEITPYVLRALGAGG